MTPKTPTKKKSAASPKQRPHKTLKSSSRRKVIWAYVRRYLPKNVWLRRVVISLFAFIFLTVSSMYGIAQWYIWQNRNTPITWGVTFVPRYAEFFGLDPKDTMQAIIDELGIKRFRLVSYWEEIETSPGTYDFSRLDWQFEKAEAAGATVSLAIGLRQPRWPECHMPNELRTEPMDVWYPRLKNVMQKVIERYRSHPSLESYQLENEFFLSVFGDCPDFTRERLIDEYNFVKQLDPDTPVVISRSNNAVGLPIGDPRPDMFAVSVYKRVWDKTITKRYFEYPFPAWFYAFLAGGGKIVTGKDMFVHELQAEAWLPEGFSQNTAPLEEQNKSLNAKRLKDRFEYGRGTGMKTIDLWGVEWWYWRKTTLGDSSLWDVAKEEFKVVR